MALPGNDDFVNFVMSTKAYKHAVKLAEGWTEISFKKLMEFDSFDDRYDLIMDNAQELVFMHLKELVRAGDEDAEMDDTMEMASLLVNVIDAKFTATADAMTRKYLNSRVLVINKAKQAALDANIEAVFNPNK
jgi:hypothetical protein